MCAVAELRVKRLEFFLRNAQGVVGRAAALVAGKAARLDVAAGLGGQLFQIGGGRVEILRLKRQIGAQDELGVLPHGGKIRRAAVGGIGALRPAVRIHGHISGRRRGRRSIAGACAAAGGKREQQSEKQGKQSFFNNRHLV